MFRQADSLRDVHAYEVAAVEYERVIYEHPGTVVAAQAALGRADCLKMTGRYDEAASALEAVNTASLPDSTAYQVLLEGTLCAYLSHEPARAYARGEMIRHYFPDSASSRDVLLLRILSLNEMKKWKEAAAVYRQYEQRWGSYNAAMDPYRHIPRLKDPDKAEKLSAYLPFTGAGLFYAGDVKEGLLNMALQVGFIAFGAYSVLMERYITGVLIGVGGYAAFYHGGVRRARRLAELHNARAAMRFNALVRSGLMGLSPEKTTGSTE